MHWPWRRNREHDLERELRLDLELEAAERQESGLSAEEARYSARRALGNTELLKEDVRATWGRNWIGSLVQDVRFGSRILVKSPGVTSAVVLSLALGLGASTALFSLLNSLLFKTLPVPAPQQLFALQHGTGNDFESSFTYPQFAGVHEQAKNSIDLFASSTGRGRLEASGIDKKVEHEFVSGDFFRILGIQPFLGRLLDPADDVRGSRSSTTAVISYRLWRSAFQSDASVAGHKILIDSVPFTIAGVTGPSFYGTEVGSHPDVWIPFASYLSLHPESKVLDCKACYWINVMGRLQPGYSERTAEAGLKVIWKNVLRSTISETLAERYKAEYFADRAALDPGATGQSSLRGRFSKPLYVLLAMTGVILLIACSNIANLLMARALARRRELAVRLSIGARRGRLIRQLVTESALLAVAGLAGSVFVYLACVNGLLRFLQSGGTDYYLDTAPDLRVTIFIAGLALGTLVLFGLIPAIRATHWRLSGTLAENAQSVSGRSSFGRLILGGQLAVSFALLAAAILLARSLYDLRTFHAGFRRENLLLIFPDTDRVVFKEDGQLRYTEEALNAIRNLPGVHSASASVVVPIAGGSWQSGFTAAGYIASRDSDYTCYQNMITPDFFRTMGTRLLMGRDFTERDDEIAPRVAVVNEGFARRYWRNENPLGKQFHELDKKEIITVVGLVEDAKYRDFRKEAPPTAYFSLAQAPAKLGWSVKLEVWTHGDPHSLIVPVRDILNRQLKDVPATFQSFTELIDQRLLYERLLTALSVSFGGLGILICAIGIYGVAAYSVSRRTAEIGIRMALGATPGAVMSLILREQFIIVFTGLTAGAVSALLATRFLRAWLFGVSPTDAPTLIGSLLGLVAITALATSIPARRAAGIEPLRALRHQ